VSPNARRRAFSSGWVRPSARASWPRSIFAMASEDGRELAELRLLGRRGRDFFDIRHLILTLTVPGKSSLRAGALDPYRTLSRLLPYGSTTLRVVA
jgi:hypothetical protein